jgi:energy-converting hydrogenase Eha subunit A
MISSRPAETGGAAGAVAIIVARVLGVEDPTTIAAIGVVVGFVPAAVTFCVEKFGRGRKVDKRP